MTQTLLIAEGDAHLCDIYRRYLTERGYDVETAGDGLDCLAKIQRRTPAAVVLDRALLWGGGDGVLACLREESATAGMPVILTSPGGRSADVSQDVTPSNVSLLQKPIALGDLLASVHGALAKNTEQAGRSFA